MANTKKKRSLTIAKHRTSVSLEEPFWQALTGLAKEDDKSIAGLVSEIDRGRSEHPGNEMSLSAAIRLYVLERTQAKRKVS